jgi:hypothetical protein
MQINGSNRQINYVDAYFGKKKKTNKLNDSLKNSKKNMKT